MSRYLYWPKGPEYAIPWFVGPVVYLLLSTFNLLGKWSDLESVPATLGAYLFLALLLFTTNGILLWVHMRAQFLTWGVARDQFWGTLLLLSTLYLLLSGVILLIRGRARMALVFPGEIDWSNTAKSVDIGLLGLTVALMASAFWKSHEPGLSNLRQERDLALDLVRLLREGGIDEVGYDRLEKTLNQIVASAQPLTARLTGNNFRILRAWEEGASSLSKAVHGIPYGVLADLGADLELILCEVLPKLELAK